MQKRSKDLAKVHLNLRKIIDFDKVASKESIVSYYDNAADLTGTLPNWGTFKVSEKVNEGDVFAVYKSDGSVYYLVKVDVITETTALMDNTDNYRVSIKY